MDNCRHYSWDLDEDGTLYCCYCDKDLSEKEKYKKNERRKLEW